MSEMTKLPDNSHVGKEAQKKNEEKRVEKVTKGAVKTKKNDVKKFTDVFISEDVGRVKSYILMDVLVPSIKKAISDIVTNGIDMILYGESGRRDKKSGSSKISYSKYYDERDRGVRESEHPKARNGWDYEDIVFDSRGDAERVLSELDEAIDKYGVISVGDLYEAAGVRTDNYTVNKYGWTNIRSADVIRTRDGYMIKLPKAGPI